jgi:DNA-binding MurR/RpiR family transcriptional regulator
MPLGGSAARVVAMSGTLMETLRRDYPGFTRAEKDIANYMLANQDKLPFDTAASIAEAAGVSQMTVSRFLRTIGFPDSGAFKAAMRAELDTRPLMVSDRIDRIRRAGEDNERAAENFDLETRALLSAYELRTTPQWRAAVEAIATAGVVGVSGFQTIRGIASDFASRLSYLRPATHFLDGSDGTFAEIFAQETASACVVLFEMRRYTRLSLQLAQAVARRRLPLVIVCDTHCRWARDLTDIVLPVRTDSAIFWDTQTAFVSLSGLMLDDVIARVGTGVTERVRTLRALQDEFSAFED